MQILDLIKKKRDGAVLTRAEIEFVVQGYTNNQFPDYQMSALLMAIYFQGMIPEETSALAQAMLQSGTRVDFSNLKALKVDKHSTGGVGDKISIPLAPLVAACGLYDPMISGRGLGHTGGTLDKLEAIPNFNVELSEAKFKQVVQKVKTAIVSASADLAPADRKIYALRDTTGTVESIPLIASSIMSKKLASGIDGLVLDVKTGSGAFMQKYEDAVALARQLIAIGQANDCQCVALITNMSQPLGYQIGNSLEIIESIEVLKGNGPADVVELTLELGAQMLVLGQIAPDVAAAKKMLNDKLHDGSALAKFSELISAQGGNPAVIENYDLLPQAPRQLVVTADSSGYVQKIATNQLGMLVVHLGGGRLQKDTPLNLSVGLTLQKKVGDYVRQGDPLVIVHYEQANTADLEQEIREAYTLSDQPVSQEKLIYEIIK